MAIPMTTIVMAVFMAWQAHGDGHILKGKMCMVKRVYHFCHSGEGSRLHLWCINFDWAVLKPYNQSYNLLQI